MIDNIDLIRRILEIQQEKCIMQRLGVRQRAEDTAISIIEENIGCLEYRDIKNIFELIDNDFWDGSFRTDRFGLAFNAPNLEHGILKAPIDLLNESFLQIYWNENLDVADKYTDGIHGAGDCFVSCLLYLKDRNRYKPFFPKLETGLQKVIKYAKGSGSFRNRYLVYNKKANELSRLCKLENQELDIILTVLDNDQSLPVL